jgi:hypothetical protein
VAAAVALHFLSDLTLAKMQLHWMIPAANCIVDIRTPIKMIISSAGAVQLLEFEYS